MTKKDKIKAMREIVRDLGKTLKWEYNGQWHERKVIRVTTDEVCEDYAYTEVEFTDNGKLEITGYDCEGTGCGDYADRFLESEIDKVYKRYVENGGIKTGNYMATLSQMCVLPEGWGAPSVSEQIGKSKRSEWLIAKRKQHDRLMAYRERERIRAERRGWQGESLSSSRQRVQRETMSDAMPVLESGGRMFYEGQGVRQPKKAKNRASKEQAGTIGRTIVVKRFEGSRLTCVCKSLIV